MANRLYDKGRNHFLTGDIKWKSAASGGDTFRAYLVDMDGAAASPATLYTPDFANDEFLNVIPTACLLSYVELIPLDPIAGVADAEDLVFPSVNGAQAEVIVLVKWVTAVENSLLIAYIDTANGLPVTPNTSDINIYWDNGDNKIFKL